MRRLAILTAALALAGGAQAEEAISTAGAAGAPPAATDTAGQIDDWIASSPAAREEGEGVLADGPRERKIHGEVGMAIGTGGYRSAYITSVMPIGETGTLALSLGQTKNGYGYGYGYGYGHGYGRFDRPLLGPDYGFIR